MWCVSRSIFFLQSVVWGHLLTFYSLSMKFLPSVPLLAHAWMACVFIVPGVRVPPQSHCTLPQCCIYLTSNWLQHTVTQRWLGCVFDQQSVPKVTEERQWLSNTIWIIRTYYSMSNDEGASLQKMHAVVYTTVTAAKSKCAWKCCVHDLRVNSHSLFVS